MSEYVWLAVGCVATAMTVGLCVWVIYVAVKR